MPPTTIRIVIRILGLKRYINFEFTLSTQIGQKIDNVRVLSLNIEKKDGA
jgi:hypothetical protein